MELHYAHESGYINGQWLNAGEVMETDESGAVVSIRPMAQVEGEQQQPQESLPPTPEAPGGPTEPLPDITEVSAPDSTGDTKNTKRKA